MTNAPVPERSKAPKLAVPSPSKNRLPSIPIVWPQSNQPPANNRTPPTVLRSSDWLSETVPGAPRAPAFAPCDAGPVVINGTDDGCPFSHQIRPSAPIQKQGSSAEATRGGPYSSGGGGG
jgi:hypothetical protein